MLVLVGSCVAAAIFPDLFAGVPSLPVDPVKTAAYSPEKARDLRAGVSPRAMPVCGYSRRVDCVVDGDTLWLDGEKIRLANIDAPEVNGRCRAEKARAAEATRRLAQLLHDRPARMVRMGSDRFDRTLAAISTSEGDVGNRLVGERRAVPWRGKREPVETWCG
jgi:endonuclease YncB( thermonuclease family)